MDAMEDFKSRALLEETFCRQKLRELWHRKGDRSTSFVHKMANYHKRGCIVKLRINGILITEEEELKTGYCKYLHVTSLGPRRVEG